MSYNLYLRDPVTKEKLEVPGHLVYGGNVACDYIDGKLIPTTTTEAYLNITYNYGGYYHEAFPGNDKKSDTGKSEQHRRDCEKYGIDPAYSGIRVLNGLSGAEAIPVLEEMIRRIEGKYKNADGTWVISKEEKTYFFNKKTGQCEGKDFIPFIAYFHLKQSTGSDDEAARIFEETYEELTENCEIDEGSGDEDYWTATAANAIKPLYQLIALSKMRPDGVWSEES